MEYVEGSIAALVSGNVTPNRPKIKKRALAPVKHQASPNVTPKSQAVGDRSIFMSPTQLKKKAILKKSPKRIFENADVEENDANTNVERVKKRLNSDIGNQNVAESPAKNKEKKRNSLKRDADEDAPAVSTKSPKKQKLNIEVIAKETDQVIPPKSPKGKKNKSKGNLNKSDNQISEQNKSFNESNATEESSTSPKKKRKHKRKNKNKNSETTQNEDNKTMKVKNDVSKNSDDLAEMLSRENKKKKNKKNKKETNQKVLLHENGITKDKTENNVDSETQTKATKSIESKNKKKNKKQNLALEIEINKMPTQNNIKIGENAKKNKKKNKKQKKIAEPVTEVPVEVHEKTKNKKKVFIKPDVVQDQDSESEYESDDDEALETSEKDKELSSGEEEEEIEELEKKGNNKSTKTKKQIIVNPNAVTDLDSASEHESDDDDSHDEEDKEVEASDKEQSSDEEEEKVKKSEKKENKDKKEIVDKKEKKEKKASKKDDEEEAKRTLFVGNVPFSKKTKKSIKNIFDQYGEIDSIRIRAIPVKDEKTTQRLAAIKNESHPDRTTANVYIKYKNADSVTKALVENNTVLEECHLRVSRTTETGAMHDPKMAIFIGNMPFSIEDEVLRAKFEKCGAIHSVRIIRDRKTNIGKGFGYVNFESKDGVELALTLTEEDLTIKNRILRVKRCTNLPPKQNSKSQVNKAKPFKQNYEDNKGKFGGKGDFGENRGKFGGKGNFRENRGKFGGKGNFGENRGKFGGESNVGAKRNFDDRGGDQNAKDGAARRVMNKRKFEENPKGGPAQKRPRNLDQPSRDKNKRKEFVGLTAEKKTKKKFDKGQKKRKAISEILAKL